MDPKFKKPLFSSKSDISQKSVVLYLLLVAILYAMTIFGIYTFNFF